MASKSLCFIRFTSPVEAMGVEWAAFSEAERIGASAAPVSPAEAKAQIPWSRLGRASVIVLLPAEDVLLTSVNLPKGKLARSSEALAYAVEGALAVPAEQVYAAALPKAGGGHVVAVADRAVVDAAAQALKQAGITPAVITSEALLLPALEEEIWLLQDGARVIFRAGADKAQALEEDTLIMYLQGLSQSFLQARMWTEGNVSATLSEALAAHAGQVELRARKGNSVLATLAQAYVEQKEEVPLINLLSRQGLPREGSSFTVQHPRAVAKVAAAAFAIGVLFNIGVGVMLNTRTANDREDAVTRWRAMFPNDPGAQAAADSMLQRVQAAGAGGQPGFVGMLNAFVRLYADQGLLQQTQVEQLSYLEETQQMKVRLKLAGMDTLEQINHVQLPTAWSAQVDSIVQNDKSVNVTLLFGRAGR